MEGEKNLKILMTNPLCNYYKMNKNNEGKNRD